MIRFQFSSTCLIIGLGLLSPVIAHAAAIEIRPSMTVQWSIPIPEFELMGARQPRHGVRAWDAIRLSDRRLALVGESDGKSAVLLNITEAGPGPITLLATPGTPMHLAAVGQNNLWIGGFTNRYMDFVGFDHADVFVARLSNDGTAIAQRTFSNGGNRLLSDMAVTLSGSVVVTARENRRTTWLAMLSPNGNLMWERNFGAGKGASLALLQGGRIGIGTFDSKGTIRDRTYQDDVAARIFDDNGNAASEAPVRDNVNNFVGSFNGQVLTSASGSALYVASSWDIRTAPIEISKVASDGALQWRTLLPESIDRGFNCHFGLVTLRNGDALVACSVENEIGLYRLQEQSGRVTKLTLPLPECHGGRPAKVFPFEMDDGGIWLLGTIPQNNVAASCTWLGIVRDLP